MAYAEGTQGQGDLQQSLAVIRQSDQFDLGVLETLCANLQKNLSADEESGAKASGISIGHADGAGVANGNVRLDDCIRYAVQTKEATYRDRQKARKANTRNRTKRQLLGEATDVDEHHIGLMATKCTSCGALHFLQERPQRRSTFNDCCRHGKVLLGWDTTSFPEELKKLLLREHVHSQEFLDNIRNYNSAMSFASINCKQDKRTQSGGPYCFRIHGQIYTRFNNAAHPSGDSPPSYGQLYLVDTEEATRHRSAVPANKKTKPVVLKLLDQIVRANSPHVAAYKMMGEVEKEVTAEALAAVAATDAVEPQIPDVRLVFK